jgi:haloacid dehalogenase superfamily, subfamily IA, variant 1 with third motif having Dx(3-4)D or Dx(3-4)E
MLKIQDFKSSGEAFLRALIEGMQDLQIQPSHISPDHLCFRVATPEEYSTYKNFLNEHSQLLTEALVNGRPIATYKFKEPFVVGRLKVDVLELPFPKASSPYVTGFEHAEFVVKDSFEQIQKTYPHIEFHRGGNNLTNPELSFKTANDLTAKFHHTTLERVIEIEKAVVSDIVFDFDGTLIESREKIFEINSRVFSTILGRAVDIAEAKAKFSPEFPKLFEFYGVTCPEKQKAGIDLWGRVAEEMHYNLFDGVLELLHSLKDKFKLHIWTARDLESTMKTLNAHGITDLFASISASHLPAPKPHQDSLQFPWESLSAHSYLMIGDSPTDMHGAKNIRAIACAAAWDPYSSHHSLINAGAELHFTKVSDLQSYLLGKH